MGYDDAARWYTWAMETVVHHVRDLRANDRSAAEQLVGHALRENQKLVIQVVDLADEQPGTGTDEGTLPEWCNVYAGLTDEEIEKLDQAIRQRANLTRVFE